jgi:hypothetical protein
MNWKVLLQRIRKEKPEGWDTKLQLEYVERAKEVSPDEINIR